MNEQMLLPVSKSALEYNPHDFIFSECNFSLKEIIDNLPRSSGLMPYKNITLITGASKSGKSHFCTLYASKVDAMILEAGMELDKEHIIVDDIENWDEENLFHIFNEICESGRIGIFVGKGIDNINLPDLKSRLSSVRNFKIDKPDDAMVRMLLSKHLASRNINASEDVIKYLMVRIPRNFEEIFKVIDLIDKEALEKKRNVNVSFLSKLLG